MRPILPPRRKGRSHALWRGVERAERGGRPLHRRVARHHLRPGCRIDGPGMAVGAAAVGFRSFRRYPRVTAEAGARHRHARRIRFPRHRSEEHTSELQSRSDIVCRLLLDKKKKKQEAVLVSKKKNDEDERKRLDTEA